MTTGSGAGGVSTIGVSGGTTIGVGSGTTSSGSGVGAALNCLDTRLAFEIAIMTKKIPFYFMCNLLLTKSVFLLWVNLRATNLL